MCTVLDEEFMLEEKQDSEESKLNTCKKCQESDATVILRKTDAYCKECFLAATTHKFRAMLGKYRVIKPNEKVLAVYRLGEPSSALIHMIRNGLDLSQHKKLRFNVEYLFIDEYEYMPKEERLNLLQKVDNLISLFNFKVYYSSLLSYLKNKDLLLCEFQEYNKLVIESVSKLNNYKNLTNTQDVTEIFKRNLTIEIAKKLNCFVVFTPEISIDTTVGILSNICLGRGSHISLNVGIIDDRDPNVKIFTPLRLFETNELEYYNNFYNIEVINLDKKSSPYESVQNLMTKFVKDLQLNYPSTIKTVTRTGDKLACKKTDHICELCKAPIEKSKGLSSIEATQFSKIVSENKITDLSNLQFDQNSKKFCFACDKLYLLAL